jgi:hypothetical protein
MTEVIEYGVEDLSEIALSTVARAAQELRKAYAEKERKEDELKVINESIRKLEFEVLPETLTALGLEKLVLEGGDTVTVKDEVAASITDPKRAAALDWLRQTNNDSIIKRQLIVSFGKGEDTLAAQILEALVLRLPDNEIVDKENVNAQTLKAFVRERLEVERANAEMVPIPRDTFSIWTGKRATVKRAKSRTAAANEELI